VAAIAHGAQISGIGRYSISPHLACCAVALKEKRPILYGSGVFLCGTSTGA